MSRHARRPTSWASLVTSARSCLRGAGGNAAIETALVLPFALLLMTGTAQAAYMLFTYNNMLHVAQEAARNVSVDASTAAEAKAWAEGKLSGFGDALVVSVNEVSSETEVTISVPLAIIAIIDPLGIFQTGSLNAAATAKDQS